MYVFVSNAWADTTVVAYLPRTGSQRAERKMPRCYSLVKRPVLRHPGTRGGHYNPRSAHFPTGGSRQRDMCPVTCLRRRHSLRQMASGHSRVC